MISGWILAIVSVLSLFGVALMMLLFAPSEVGALGLLTFFLLCYLSCVWIAVTMCRGFFYLRGVINKRKRINSMKAGYFYGLVIAIAPVLLLMARTFGVVSFAEWGFVIVIEVILCCFVKLNLL